MDEPNEGEAPVIVGLADAAMHMYSSAIDSLPDADDKKFQKRADVILSGLRKLRASLTEAASRSRSTAAVIVALSDVRRRYDDLMARAAVAPGSGLGQQLYVARVRARLSAQEVANGAGLRADLLDDLEAGEIATEEETAKVKQLIAALGGAAESADSTNSEQTESHHDGHEESHHDGHEESHHDGHEESHHDGHEESHMNGWDESRVGNNGG